MEEMEKKIKASIMIDAHACTVVEVDGEKTGKWMRHILYAPYLSLKKMNKRIPGTGASYRMGVPAAILTKLLGKGRIKTKGVVIYERIERILP